MEASREKNGNTLADTLGIGKITAKMALVSSSTKMETSTKECGLETRDTVKVLTGVTREASSEESTLEIGLKIKSTVEAPSSTKMETDMTVIGSMECLKAKEE